MNHSNIDILSLGHFLLWYIVGIYYKNKYIEVLFLGIMWEIFEYIISNNNEIKKIIIDNWIIPEKYWNDTLSHKIVDITFNMIGYYYGNKVK